VNSAAAPSAHVCTPSQLMKPRRAINLGRIVAGEAVIPAKPQPVTVDLSAFADALPTDPASDADDATFWALTARAYMAELQAACTLAAQLRAGRTIPNSLGRTLLSLERMLREKIRANIKDHASCGGKEAAQLLVDLNAITVPAARGAT